MYVYVQRAKQAESRQETADDTKSLMQFLCLSVSLLVCVFVFVYVCMCAESITCRKQTRGGRRYTVIAAVSMSVCQPARVCLSLCLYVYVQSITCRKQTRDGR